MTAIFDSARDYAQRFPWSATVIVVLPGACLYLVQNSGDSALESTTLSPVLFGPDVTHGLSIHSSTYSKQLAIPISRAGSSTVATIAHQCHESARKTIKAITAASKDRISNLSLEIQQYPPRHVISFALAAALPTLFVLAVHQFPDSRAKKHQTTITALLHFIVLASLANSTSDTHDLLIAALGMVVFDAFQAVVGREDANATRHDESEHQTPAPSVGETVVNPTNVQLTNSDTARHLQTILEHEDPASDSAPQSGEVDTKPTTADSKDREIVRLERTISELRDANKAQEKELRSVREELHNVREALEESCQERFNLHKQTKTLSQVVGSDYQPVDYRKEIELFELRKRIEQKEQYNRERDIRFEEMYEKQRNTIEVKDAQLKILTERLALMDRQADQLYGVDENGNHALEVRLLRVGRSSRNRPEKEDDKDLIISRLQEQLAAVTKTSEAVVNQQAELRRAWDITKQVQDALKREREHHSQTSEQLQELNVKWLEQEDLRSKQATAEGRLATITEDESDTKELEAMFDAAQKDNLRLNEEVETLEKRVRDANARMFTAEQDVHALLEQLRLEKARADTDKVRPSLVQRAHFHRLEGQLKDSQNVVAAKEAEIARLKKSVAEKDSHIKSLNKEVEAAVTFHTQDQDEIEGLKKYVEELKATKEQLMLDHERLALQRTRQRVAPIDRVSARSSGATLIQDLSPQVVKSTDSVAAANGGTTIPAVAEVARTGSRSTIQTLNILSEPIHAPPDVKHTRRKSLGGLKDLMKRMVRKDTEDAPPPPPAPHSTHNSKSPERQARRVTVYVPPLRPQTADALAPTSSSQRPLSSHQPLSRETKESKDSKDIPTTRPQMSRSSTPRYYAATLNAAGERPRTGNAEEVLKTVGNRRSWAATNKLKRRSLY